MKLLILLLFISVLGIKGFTQQGPKHNTLKGKNASYDLIDIDEYYMIARNIHNVDTTRDMYYDNGEMVPGSWDLGGGMKCSYDELISTVRSGLTQKEWETMENAESGFLKIWIVADKAGEPLEMEFTFSKTDPVFAKMDPDRLFLIEEKLKKILKLEVAEADRNIKRMKYFISFHYRYLK